MLTSRTIINGILLPLQRPVTGPAAHLLHHNGEITLRKAVLPLIKRAEVLGHRTITKHCVDHQVDAGLINQLLPGEAQIAAKLVQYRSLQESLLEGGVGKVYLMGQILRLSYQLDDHCQSNLPVLFSPDAVSRLESILNGVLKFEITLLYMATDSLKGN